MGERDWPVCVERLRAIDVGSIDDVLCAAGWRDESALVVWEALRWLQRLATTQPPEPAAVCADGDVVEAVATIRNTGDECLIADIHDLANVAGNGGDEETCEWFRAVAALVGAAHDGRVRPISEVRAEAAREERERCATMARMRAEGPPGMGNARQELFKLECAIRAMGDGEGKP